MDDVVRLLYHRVLPKFVFSFPLIYLQAPGAPPCPDGEEDEEILSCRRRGGSVVGSYSRAQDEFSEVHSSSM